MSSTRRRSATIASTLATATRDVRRAVRAGNPAHVPGLVPLRDAGWQLTQLTGELSDLVALLAEHTGHHTEHADPVRHTDGEPAADQVARACQELAALRRAFDTAHTAARAYYTAVSLLTPAPTMNSAERPDQPDPYVVLGVDPGASGAEITAAYRRAVRACHPDTPDPDRDRLAAVITAYHHLRDQVREHDAYPPAREHPRSSARGVDIPVRLRPRDPPPSDPDLRAGPVRWHPPQR